ncbi:MAG: cbb3-type cytochrome c oxidase subunit 3 [Bacteroidia bacterium]|nr:MAG: cbb3-type cytochrome c oxidase subunit 3 [Bacteroidia bacterium]
MKFTTYLKEIEQVQLFPIISLVIFVTVFVAATIYALTKDKKEMDEIAEIPLKD